HDRKKDVIINPKVIFEVLSPSTEKYDRHLKFQRYRLGNESLTDYILIAQDIVSIEHYHRDAENRWIYEGCVELTDVLRLPELELEIPAELVYDRVEVQPPPEN
ncbi:MAG: Uma2 family endonuclease, partial [Acidobacteriota bacterium]|nr:Uma2 family endonuclease [Acidobacteriota bacterium]